MSPRPPKLAAAAPWASGDDSPKGWWQNGWVLSGWVACMVTAILWQGVPLDLPHPSGYLIYGLGFAPWLRIAIAFPRRSLAEGTTLDVISLLVWRKQRWVGRVEHAGWFWSNVLFVVGLGGWAGCSGVWMLWVGLLDLATLVRLWLTGPA